MADGVAYDIEGLEELRGKLRELTYDVRYKGGRFALRKAAQVVRDAARANAERIDDPSTDEKISANIVEKWSTRRFRRTRDLSFRIGVLGGAKGPPRKRKRGRSGPTLEELGEIEGRGKNNPGGDTWYWRLLEFGTSKMPAQPFLRRAMSDNVNAATNEFIVEYGKAAGRAIKRAKKVK